MYYPPHTNRNRKEQTMENLKSELMIINIVLENKTYRCEGDCQELIARKCFLEKLLKSFEKTLDK